MGLYGIFQFTPTAAWIQVNTMVYFNSPNSSLDTGQLNADWLKIGQNHEY